MILYVNGDSHTAAAEAVNPHAFAGDDGHLDWGDRRPHPDNLAVSWGKQLSDQLSTEFICHAESGSSNTRILRTTRQWLNNNQHQDKLVIIQWSTWEREEWLIDNQYYQVNGSGIDIVPAEYQQTYKEYIANLNWSEKTEQAHQDIWQLHQELLDQNIPHVFFNGNNHFGSIKQQLSWGNNYVEPYNPTKTYDAIIRSNGYLPVNSNSWHFGKDGHRFFSNFMLQYIIDNQIIKG